MACSPAQLEANRRNAARSTGPRSPEGKANSRRNGLKHGLTGEGIVLPHEDAEEVDRRIATLEAEIKPRTEMARHLVGRLALLTLRLERSAEHEAKAASHRMRKARAEFDDARLAEVERLYSWIASEPATNARRLRNSPEGIDRMIAAIEALRADFDHPGGCSWGFRECDQLHHLLGLRRSDVPASRPKALTEAIGGDFANLTQADRPDLEGLDRQCWAASTLMKLIDGELEALRKLRDEFDHEGLELDRAEAAARAMFDASKESMLARKYEAATERGLYRALREIRQLQVEAPEVVASSEVADEPTEELASSLPAPPAEDVEEVDGDASEIEADREVMTPAVEAIWEGTEGGPIDDRTGFSGGKRRTRSR